MKYGICVLLVAALSGCATAPPPQTASGKLESTLKGVRVDCVRNELVNKLVNSGFTIKSSNEYQIVAGKPDSSQKAALLYGTPANPFPENRVTITLIPQTDSDSLRLVFDEAFVSNPGTGAERVNLVSGSQAQQEKMDSGPHKLEEKCAKTPS